MLLSMMPKKGPKTGHVNICSLRNKVQDIDYLLASDKIHRLAISEKHLENTFDDATVEIQGYSIYRKDRDNKGGRVAAYIQNHIPVKVRDDLMSCDGMLPHVKPILLGCCYRPPSSNSQYLDNLCEMGERACNENSDMYFLGDLNMNCLATSCPLKHKVLNVTRACNPIQVFTY